MGRIFLPFYCVINLLTWIVVGIILVKMVESLISGQMFSCLYSTFPPIHFTCSCPHAHSACPQWDCLDLCPFGQTSPSWSPPFHPIVKY
jgi:hypothetical protein